MKTKALLLAGVALGISACKPAADKPARVDIAAEQEAIRAKEATWLDAYNRRDAKTLAAQYAEDAGLASYGMALMTDSMGRGLFLDGLAKDPALKVDFASDRIIVAASGELASSRGHYMMTFTDPATKKPKTETGNYLTVYRKAADGSWQAIEDFTTPGPATAQAPTAAVSL